MARKKPKQLAPIWLQWSIILFLGAILFASVGGVLWMLLMAITQ